jgi:hypothetical protein
MRPATIRFPISRKWPYPGVRATHKKARFLSKAGFKELLCLF